MSENIYTEKKKYWKILKDFFKFTTKNKSIGLILVKDLKNIDFLLDGLEVLSCDFIIKTEQKMKSRSNVLIVPEIKKDLLLWFDFIITDNDTQGLNEYFQLGIAPIIPQNHHFSSILKEFDPLLNQWNSFLYKENDKWSLYYAIIRYLENYKFSYDNRNLIKNVIHL
jgi:hypothetical protein